MKLKNFTSFKHYLPINSIRYFIRVGKVRKIIRILKSGKELKLYMGDNLTVFNGNINELKPVSFVDQLEKYFNETSNEKILEDWEKSKEWDDVGVLVNDFIKI